MIALLLAACSALTPTKTVVLDQGCPAPFTGRLYEITYDEDNRRLVAACAAEVQGLRHALEAARPLEAEARSCASYLAAQEKKAATLELTIADMRTHLVPRPSPLTHILHGALVGAAATGGVFLGERLHAESKWLWGVGAGALGAGLVIWTF